MNKTVRQRRQQVDKASSLSVVGQCELLEIHRSGLYYKAVGESDLNLKLMRLIDEHHMKYPWLGVLRMTTWLKKDMGFKINHKHIERLYTLMGISAIGPKPNTSKKAKGILDRIYNYLLKGLRITYPNQIWAMDITYIPVKGGYLYLCAIIDLYSRFVVGWSLSNTMTSQWCRTTLETAIAIYGKPDIINTDQGSQFTADEFTQWVTHLERDIKLSMDGKGRAIDNIFIERLWRSVKYEHVYLFPADDGLQCYKGIKEYFEYYNNQRRHQSLDDEVPVKVYQQKLKPAA
ncbi:MAG: IS3 family transposase [Bacteroidota bacterium]